MQVKKKIYLRFKILNLENIFTIIILYGVNLKKIRTCNTDNLFSKKVKLILIVEIKKLDLNLGQV